MNADLTKKVLLVDDHPAFRRGLAQILAEEKDLKVCGQAGTAAQALQAIRKLKPDLALVDISLPGKSGLELIKEVRAKGLKTKLLVVSMHDEALYANRVLRAGGNGYIMKQEDPAEIVVAIRDVLSGHTYVSEAVLSVPGKKPSDGGQSKAQPTERLADLELEILEQLGKGKTNREIARELNLGIGAVTKLGARIRKKLGLKTDNALIRYAVCWVESDPISFA